MNKLKPPGISRTGYFIFSVLLISLSSGCGNKFFDPTQVGRFSHTPAGNIILDTLGVTEEPLVAWEMGEEPRPIDSIVMESDYTFMSGDILYIKIYELFERGIWYEQECVVTETGNISIPHGGILQVTGLTETGLEDLIERVLTPDTLLDPLVTVTLLQSPQRTYSILGQGVARPNRYQIPRYGARGFRLTDALALAGSTSQENVSYVFVLRPVKPGSDNPGTSKSDFIDYQSIDSAYNLKESILPESIQQQKQKPYQFSGNKVVVSSSEMVMDRESDPFIRDFDVMDRESDPFIRDFDRWLINSTRERAGGRDTYQFSDMGSEQDAVQNRVSVEEVLGRMSGRSVNTNQMAGRVDVESINDDDTYRSSAPDDRVINEQLYNSGAQDTPYKSVDAEPEGRVEWMYQNGTWVPVEVETSTSKPGEIQDVTVDWELQGDKWVPVQKGGPTQTGIPTQNGTSLSREIVTEQFPWVEQPSQTRLIKIPIEKLVAGDPRYNIAIKPGDTINVPVDAAGYFYIMGNANRSGAVQMTGGRMTLKQVVAAAGGLGPLAWPKRCEIIRRIGNNNEITVRVDLERIFNGEDPDFYIKPHDIINIGTHATSRWRAILRNAFRATYGFGFVYDRNFADRDFYTSRPFSIF